MRSSVEMQKISLILRLPVINGEFYFLNIKEANNNLRSGHCRPSGTHSNLSTTIDPFRAY